LDAFRTSASKLSSVTLRVGMNNLLSGRSV
jgi:hypothetical protein